MRRILMIAVVLLSTVLVKAQDNSNRIGVGLGGFYRPAASATLFWEHETHYHNAWEFFATGSLKLDDFEYLGTNYRCWGVGAAWKPCVYRARNRYGSAMPLSCAESLWLRSNRREPRSSSGGFPRGNPCRMAAQLCLEEGLAVLLAGRGGRDDSEEG